MYNNIGLQTPRGSGTSGYIMANKAKAKPQRSRLEFLKELKQLRENVLPPPRKANQDIINHMEKREIYVKLAELRASLSSAGELSAEEIEEKLQQTEQDLLRKFASGDLRQAMNPEKNEMRDTHALALIKEQEQQRLKNAFRVDGRYEFGSAFDFDNQEKIRLEKAYKREMVKMERSQKKKEESPKRKEELKLKKKLEKEKLKKKKQNKKDEDSSSSSSGSSSGSSRSSSSSSGSSSGDSSSDSSSSSESDNRDTKKKKDAIKSSSRKGDKGEKPVKTVEKGKEGRSSSQKRKKTEKRERSRSRDKAPTKTVLNRNRRDSSSDSRPRK